MSIEQSAGDLAGRVVIVTGAGQGIGRAFAHAFAEDGAIAVIAERDAERGERVARDVRDRGGQAHAAATDVGSRESVGRLVEDVVQRFGRIDVLINNASIFSSIKLRPFEEIPDEEWDRVLHTNVTGVFYTVRAVSPIMRQAGWGRIVNISSAAIMAGRAGYLHYTTSKAAIVGMTRSLAREMGNDGVTVNAILPGATDTEIERETVTPERRQQLLRGRSISRGQVPDDLVGLAKFLGSSASSFITGQSIIVDGGNTFL